MNIALASESTPELPAAVRAALDTPGGLAAAVDAIMALRAHDPELDAWTTRMAEDRADRARYTGWCRR